MPKKDYLSHAAKIAQEKASLKDVVCSCKNFLDKHFSNIEDPYRTHSIIESRLIPAEFSFEIGMKSCGSITNIIAEMLRHIGYDVRKIHGTTPNSTDHSWIKVKDPKTTKWFSYDLTQKECKVSKDHIELADCNEWEDIAEVLVKSYFKFSKQRSKTKK